MIREEVAHSYGTNLSCFVSFFQVTISTIAVAVRLVEEHQVDVVGLQFAQSLSATAMVLIATWRKLTRQERCVPSE